MASLSEDWSARWRRNRCVQGPATPLEMRTACPRAVTLLEMRTACPRAVTPLGKRLACPRDGHPAGDETRVSEGRHPAGDENGVSKCCHPTGVLWAPGHSLSVPPPLGVPMPRCAASLRPSFHHLLQMENCNRKKRSTAGAPSWSLQPGGPVGGGGKDPQG